MSRLVYYSQCASTNDEIIDFINFHDHKDAFFAVYTFNQTHGRGQYGNLWKSNPNENLAFSFALSTKKISVADPLLNYYIAIIVRDFLAEITQTDVKIKWPNDLIIHQKKIGGILFEKKAGFWITGIGINVLQINFDGLPKAGSISTTTGKKPELEAMAEMLYSVIQERLINNELPSHILETYQQFLFKRDEVAFFETSKGRQNGIIKKADETGKIWIELEEDGLQSFYHKELTMLY